MTFAIAMKVMDMLIVAGKRYYDKKSQKPVDQWTDADALKWLDEYEKELDETTTDAILPDPDED